MARIVKKLKLVQDTLRVTVLLLEIGVKTLYITVAFLEISDVCEEAKNCAKQSAEL